MIFLRPHIPTLLPNKFKNSGSQNCGQINYLYVCVFISLQHGLRLGRGRVGVFHGHYLLISPESKKMPIVNFSTVKLLITTSLN